MNEVLLLLKKSRLWFKYIYVVCFLAFSPIGSSPIHPHQRACQDTQFSFGVLDRFENNIAVILLEDTDQEWHIPINILPSQSQEQTWMKITCIGSRYEFEIEEQKSKDENERAKELLLKLRKRK